MFIVNLFLDKHSTSVRNNTYWSLYISYSIRTPTYLPLGCKSYRMCRPVVCAITAGATITTRHGTATPSSSRGPCCLHTRPTKRSAKQADAAQANSPTSIPLFIWYSAQCLYPIGFVQLCNCSSSTSGLWCMDGSQPQRACSRAGTR